ncbi:MAG TPA: sulfotransferase [Solirubrobacteraceae bacterium]|nr:sulfotransferase [Solirubrobacteraceae bacterium]
MATTRTRSVVAEQMAARETGSRTPEFFIVGSPKSGSTALYEMLSRHPQIFMPELKEPRFLAEDMAPRPGFEKGPADLGYPVTLDEYLALFAQATPAQRLGEASTTYLWSRTAASNIAQLRADSRIIATIREPASFLHSLHFMLLRWHVEGERSFTKALSLEADRREGRNVPDRSHRPQLLQYSEHVRYVEQLRRYYERFAEEQVLVLIYDDFRRDNEGTLRRIMQFLDVDSERPVEPVNVNVTKTTRVRAPRLYGAVRSASMGRGTLPRAAKATIKSLTTQQLRRGTMGRIHNRVVVSEPLAAPEESFMTELRERYKPEVVALSEFLGRDLVSLWGYDSIG